MRSSVRERLIQTLTGSSSYGRATPFAQGFHLAEGKAGQTQAAPSQMPGNLAESEDVERHLLWDDPDIEQLMENVKRYIRNIDISDL
jgi:hypothetical protein